MSPRIGVLAYGSLIKEAGEELRRAEVERRSGIRTPFRVEFARSSSTRDGAPTLVPVDEGGGHVEAEVIVLRDGVGLDQARDMVYRREIGCVGQEKKRYQPDPTKKNQVYVETLPSFAGLDWVLYTRIAADIEERSAEHLAELAIKSASCSAGAEYRDGICYLRDAIAAGIRTPLSEAYRAAILEDTDASSLDEAWDKVREKAAAADSG